MKFLHLADIHFGKSLHSLSLIESGDQSDWVEKILNYISENKPDAVVIAGDVYDRSIPAREAIPLLSHMLTSIARMNIPVLLTAGNHDGGDRLEFASELLKEQNVYISGTLQKGQKELVHLTRDFGDGYGPVTIWLLPYTYPAMIREALSLPEDSVPGYTESIRKLLEAQYIDFSQRNILVAHQTVLHEDIEPEQSGSETSIGGVGGIDYSAFDGFDYVALGHIHGAQKVGRENIRYAGSPLCYHFNEASQKKGPLMVTLGAKNTPPEIVTGTIPPLHRVRPTMTGTLSEIINAEKMSSARNEYVRVILTDDLVPPNTREQLTQLFESHGCKLLDLVREPKHSGSFPYGANAQVRETLSLEDHFFNFYRLQRDDEDPTREEAELIRFVAGEISNGLETDEDMLAEALVNFVLDQEVNPE